MCVIAVHQIERELVVELKRVKSQSLKIMKKKAKIGCALKSDTATNSARPSYESSLPATNSAYDPVKKTHRL
jgi:hypothetical protein